jgi:hypothetical protein
MVDVIPTKREIVSIVEAQKTTIQSFTERLVKLENLNEKQDSKNQNIIVGVLVALILIVATVAVEVILSNKKDAQFYSGLEKNIYEQNLKVQDLNNQISNIKTRNSYLK